jgi:hypothetical protein
MQFGPYDIKKIQLKSYLRDFFVAPDMSEPIWGVAGYCMSLQDRGAFGFKFLSELSMRQFGLACLLSCGKQLTWESVKSYSLLQENLDNRRLLIDYGDYDVLFILHEAGTMRNSIMSDFINQVVVLRGRKKTFFLDVGGPPLVHSGYRVVPVMEAYQSLGKKALSLGEFDI